MHKWLCWVLLAGWLGLGCDRKPAEPDRLSLAGLQPPATAEELATAYDQLSLELDRLQALPSIGPNSPDFRSAWLRASAVRKQAMALEMQAVADRWATADRADVLRWEALRRRAAEDDRLCAPQVEQAVAAAEARGVKPR